MKRSLWPTRDSVKDYFPLPKEIFSLGLSAVEIAIYASSCSVRIAKRSNAGQATEKSVKRLG